LLDYKQQNKIKKLLKEGKRIVDSHPKQAEIYDDNTPNRVICAGRRFGKSILMILLCLQFVLNNPGCFAYIISPVKNRACEMNLWKDFETLWNLLYKYGGFNKLGISVTFSISSSSITFDIPVKDENGTVEIYESLIVLESAFNPSRTEGVGIDFLGIDEARNVDNLDELWDSVNGALMPNSKVVIISTMAKNYDKFYEFIKWGDEKSDKKLDGWKTWMLKSSDNVTLDGWKETLNNKKKTSSHTTYLRDYEPDLFDFSNVTGSICTNFTRERNVIEGLTMFPDKRINISTDFNVWCMTTIVSNIMTREELLSDINIRKQLEERNIKLQDEVICVFKEFKFAGIKMNVDDLCVKIKEWLLSTNYNAEKYGANWYGDPHGHSTTVNSPRDANDGDLSSSWITVQKHFPTFNYYNDKFERQENRFHNFNDKVQNYLGEVGVLISSYCQELTKDLEQVRWDESGKHIDKSQERKHIGHLADDISYQVSYDFDLKQPDTNISGITIPLGNYNRFNYDYMNY
jgi:hypothetical protein